MVSPPCKSQCACVQILVHEHAWPTYVPHLVVSDGIRALILIAAYDDVALASDPVTSTASHHALPPLSLLTSPGEDLVTTLLEFA